MKKDRVQNKRKGKNDKYRCGNPESVSHGVSVTGSELRMG
jgi:hypothetical protein